MRRRAHVSRCLLLDFGGTTLGGVLGDGAAGHLQTGLTISLRAHFHLQFVEHAAELGVGPAGLLVDLRPVDAARVGVQRCPFIPERVELLPDALERLVGSRRTLHAFLGGETLLGTGRDDKCSYEQHTMMHLTCSSVDGGGWNVMWLGGGKTMAASQRKAAIRTMRDDSLKNSISPKAGANVLFFGLSVTDSLVQA